MVTVYQIMGVVMSEKYLSDSMQRVLDALMLIESTDEPVKPGIIAESLKCAPALATRAMENLASAGLAQRNKDGAWEAGAELKSWRRRIVRNSLAKIMEAI